LCPSHEIGVALGVKSLRNWRQARRNESRHCAESKFFRAFIENTDQFVAKPSRRKLEKIIKPPHAMLPALLI
jgi:hypothetical protein